MKNHPSILKKECQIIVEILDSAEKSRTINDLQFVWDLIGPHISEIHRQAMDLKIGMNRQIRQERFRVIK